MDSLFTGIGEAENRDVFVVEACRAARKHLNDLMEQHTVEAIDEIWELQQQFQGFSKGGNLRTGFTAMTAVMETSRRADRALTVAVRRAQEAGIVRSNRSATTGRPSDPSLPSPRRWTSHGNTRQELYALTDRVSDEEFERALGAARTDGNLSRRNVLRHIRQAERTDDWVPNPEDHTSPAAARRVQLIREMAQGNMSSRQISDRIGTLAGTIRMIARRNNIEIPADKIIGKTRWQNADRIMEETANALAGLAMSMELVDPAGVDRTLAPGWLASIAASVKTINQVTKSVREETS